VILPVAGVLWEMNTLIKRQFLVPAFVSLVFATAMLTAPLAHAEGTLKGGLQIIHGQLYDANGRERGDATLSNAMSLVKMEGINIIMPDELGQIRIGDLRLQDAPGDLAVRALSEASGNKFVVKELHSELGPGNPLIVLETNRPPSPPPSEVKVEAINLAGYIQHLKLSGKGTNIDDTLDKLQRTIVEVQKDLNSKTRAGSSSPTFRFFADADLLIVIGAPDAVEIARKIVNALPGEDPFSAAKYEDQLMRVIPGQNQPLLNQMSVPTTNSP
jgi:hypothetical protein